MGVKIGEATAGPTCDVLGSFSDDFATWSPLLEDQTGDFIGLQLVGGDGSACATGPPGANAYSMTVNFNCYTGNPKDRVKSSSAATGFIASMGSGCSPVYQINTCLACSDGCANTPPAPSPSGAGSGKGLGWFAWTCIIIFGILLPLYVVGGFLITKRLPPPFDRCASLSRRTQMLAGKDNSYTSAELGGSNKGGTTYGAVSDSI